MLALSRFNTCCLALAVALTASAAAAQSWDQLRGPGADMYAGDLPEGTYGLREAWKIDLGSGYSNVWIADGKAVTLFTAGDVDVVGAFELASGDELWRYELGEKYAGHDGSDDGPLSTPTVSGGMVYVLGPNGQLVALGLADGAEKWKRTLDEENSTVPFYGYTSSPLVVDGLVILATGGEGHAVSAFDRETGEPSWTAGDDAVTYQTPMLVELGGRKQILAATDRFLQGIDPTKGEVLWQLQHTEDDAQAQQSAHPTVIDGERFLVKYGRGARLYRYTGNGVEEVWQTNAFGNTFALPVLVGDHLYGFTGNVMTCVHAETGEIAWRSRDVGSFGLSAIDGVLAVLTREGDLVLVEPSPEGYREKTRLTVFERGNYAVPSYADGSFVVRNLEQMAAVRVDTSAPPRTAEAAVDDAPRLRGEFGRWVAWVESLPTAERRNAVERRFADVETPLVGEGGLAHVVWRGEAEDVAVRGDIVPGGQELSLDRVAGTDLFFKSFELDPKAQYTYNLVVDYGNPTRDPGNPHFVDNGFGQASELRMPEWPASPHLDPPAEDAARGKLDGFPFRSDILDNTREIQVWRPAGYGQDPEQRYPVLIVNHGDNLVRGSLMQNSLDNLVGKTVEPLIAVFVPRTNPAEYGGPNAADYNRFLVEELLPHLDRHYATDPDRRAIMGPGSAGVAAVYAALGHSEVFRQAAVQSFYPIEPAQEQIPEMISSADPKPELLYVVWSRHDYDLGPGRQAEQATRELLGQLRDAGIQVTEQVADYSPGWAGWRGQHDEILAALFPAPQGD